MIHDIGRDLEESLQTLGVPFKVVDGPEDTSTATYARERIVIEHDLDAGDRYVAVKSQHGNPKQHRGCQQGVKITIHAQSPKVGAMLFEHRRRAAEVRDAVVCALDEIAKARHNNWDPTGGRFVEPTDLEQSARPGGATYELKFWFDRGISKRTWNGDVRPTASVGPGGIVITSTDSISTNGSGSSETAC